MERRATWGLAAVVGVLLALFGALVVGVLGARGAAFPAITLGPWALYVVAGRRRRLRVDADGVTVRGWFGERRVVFADITHYTLWSKGRGAAGGLGGAVATLAVAAADAARERQPTRRFVVGALRLYAAGQPPLVIHARYRDAAPLLDAIFAAIHPRLDAAADVAPFSLGATALEHPDAPLAYADIDKIELHDARLIIRKRGQARVYARLFTDQVRNVMVLVRALAARGVPVVAVDAFVPADVIAGLRAGATTSTTRGHAT